MIFAKTMTRVAAIALPMIGAVAIATAARAAEIELRFGAISAAATPLYSDFLVPYARAIEAESGGRIAIDLRPQGGYGTPVELLSQVEAGTIDMAVTIPSYYPGRFPRTSVMELPTIFATAESGSRAVWTLYEEGLIAADYKGLKVLGLYTSAPFGILLTDKNVKSLRDLRGMRIRVSGATAGLSFSRLGLVPLGLPTNLLGRALDSDWVDALSFGFDTAAGTTGKPPLMVVDQVSTLIDANFSAPAQITIMNAKSFEKLPRDLQAIIDRLSGLAFSVRAGQARDVSENEVKHKLMSNPKYHSFVFSDQDRAEIAERIKPVFDDWAADLNANGIDAAPLLKRARELTAQTNS